MSKKLPKFKSVEDEALFWEEHSLGDYYSEGDFTIVEPSGKSKSVLLRLNLNTIIGSKKLASENGLKYQTLLKKWIDDGLKRGI